MKTTYHKGDTVLATRGTFTLTGTIDLVRVMKSGKVFYRVSYVGALQDRELTLVNCPHGEEGVKPV